MHYSLVLILYDNANFQTFACLLDNLVFEDEVKICNKQLTDLELWKILVVWSQVQKKKLRCAVCRKPACDVFRSDRWKFTQVKYLILRVVSSRKMPYVSVCFNIVVLFVKMIAWIVNSWSIVNKCIQTIIFIVVRYIYILAIIITLGHVINLYYLSLQLIIIPRITINIYVFAGKITSRYLFSPDKIRI